MTRRDLSQAQLDRLTTAELARELGLDPGPSHAPPTMGAVLGRPIVQRVPAPSVVGPGSVGLSSRREADLMSRLPAAELAGVSGPGVVAPPKLQRGARPGKDNSPIPTYRPLAGAQENNRGAAVVVRLGGAASLSEQTISTVVQTSRENGDDAETISVVLGYQLAGNEDDPTGAGFASAFSPRALLTWGIGGASFSAEVDWRTGTRIDLAASFVRVGLQIPAMTLGLSEFDVTFSAALSYGYAASKAGAARLTENIFGAPPAPQVLLAGATSGDIIIPPFADTVAWLGGGSAPSGQFFMFGAAGAGLFYTSPLSATPQQIPNGQRIMQVKNTGATPLGGLLVFGLAL